MPTATPAPQHRQIHDRPFVFSVWGNPLARAVDRVEAALIVLLLGIWLLTLPVAAVAGSITWASISDNTHAQQAVPVTAQLLASTDAAQVSGYSTVPARWTDTDGVARTGLVQADDGLQSGDRFEIWLDRSGAVTTAPMTTLSAAIQAVIVATATWNGCGLVLAAVFLTGRRLLDTRRISAWRSDWQRVGPLWTTQ